MLSLIIQNLYKKYDETELFNGLNLCFSSDKSYALLSPSGSGKTTLLRIIAGLDAPDSGSIIFMQNNNHMSKKPRISMVFQEDRLCEDFSAVDNMLFATNLNKSESISELSILLPDESLFKPVRFLSGGQRRRLCIVRAMNIPEAEIILMDEPFTGLDQQSKELSCRYIQNKKKDRLLLLSTHNLSDLKLLNLTPTEF